MDPGGNQNGQPERKRTCDASLTQDRNRIIAKVEQYAQNPPSFANQVIKLTGSEYWRLCQKATFRHQLVTKKRCLSVSPPPLTTGRIIRG